MEGLFYFKNIVENSKEIVEQLDSLEWKPVGSGEKSRVVQQFGRPYIYRSNSNVSNVSIELPEIPDFLGDLQEIGKKMLKELNIEFTNLDQCICNNYLPGQGISAHVDALHFGPVIVCFTLCSGTSIIFKNKKDKDKISVEQFVEPNSLYIMSGDCRYNWTHEIRGRLSDSADGHKILRSRRISVTFRAY